MKHSSNPVFLQQKIIHLQSELSRCQSMQKKYQTPSQIQELTFELEKMRNENTSLKEQIAKLQSELERFQGRNTRTKKQSLPSNKVNSREASDDYEDHWFVNNLNRQNAFKK